VDSSTDDEGETKPAAFKKPAVSSKGADIAAAAGKKNVVAEGVPKALHSRKEYVIHYNGA